MGIDMINLGSGAQAGRSSDLAELEFRSQAFPNNRIQIWMMASAPGKSAFPWWSFHPEISSDIEALHKAWRVTGPQSLLDVLFLREIQRHAGDNLFVIFPGFLQSRQAQRLAEDDRQILRNGMSCTYHLEAALQQKLAISWVPFWEPQSVVRAPKADALWRLFLAARQEETVNCITFFSLSQPKALPEVMNLLKSPNAADRSQRLATMVDWFGVYSSPSSEKFAPCAVIYSAQMGAPGVFAGIQRDLRAQVQGVRDAMITEPGPATLHRYLDRHIP